MTELPVERNQTIMALSHDLEVFALNSEEDDPQNTANYLVEEALIFGRDSVSMIEAMLEELPEDPDEDALSLGDLEGALEDYRVWLGDVVRRVHREVNDVDKYLAKIGGDIEREGGE